MPDLDAIITARRAAKSGLGRALRRASHLTQSEIGGECGVSGACVSRWESGDRMPRGAPAVKYGELLARLSEGQ
jgi:DNA-binding transcriptional regulator YiaG